MSSSDDNGFLNTVEDDDGSPKMAGDIVLATGINWSKLGLTMIGSLVAGWFLGLWTFIQGVFKFFTNEIGTWSVFDASRLDERGAYPNSDLDPEGGIFDALASFAADVVGAILSGPGDLLTAAARESIGFVESTFTGPLAFLAFPVGVAIFLSGLWVAARGLEEVRS